MGITQPMTGPIATSSSSRHGSDTQTLNATHASVSAKAIAKRTVGRRPRAGALRRVRPPNRSRGGRTTGSPSETAISSSIEESCGVAPPGRRRPSVWSGCKRRLPRMWRSAREQAPPPEHSRGGGWLRIGGGDGRCGSQGVQDAIGSTFDGATWLGSAVVWARPRRNRPKRVLSGEARTGHAS